MITVTVTSDSSVPELHMARRAIIEMIELRSDVALGVANVDKRWEPTLDEICEHFKVPPKSEFVGTSVHKVIVDEVFNATELAEAEALGKPVCSTVDASQSTIAHADTQVNTSLPEPTSVFGQSAQTTVNEANPVVPTTVNPVLDAKWIPWDSRIHSSSKEMVKDGTWRKRRGVDAAMVAQVEAELRGVPKFVELPSTLQPVTHVDVTPTVGTMTFTELLDGVTKAMVAGQLSQERINGALATVGLTALPNLLGNPALIPEFRQALGGVV